MTPELPATDSELPRPASRPSGGQSLSPTTRSFVLHWGEMGSRWGVNRTVAQIHGLLYISARPMHAEEISEILSVARSNVSNSLRELQGWNLIKTVHMMGDRRDHFETSSDVWELFHTIVEGRKAREFDPTLSVLKRLIASPELGSEPEAARTRIGEMVKLMEILSSWSEELLRLDPPTLVKIMKLGAKIQNLVRRPVKGKS